MSAEGFTRAWVRAYTRGLPDDVRAARGDEIDSDLHEHRSDGARGAAIVGRTLRGVPADVMWRREERRAMEAISGRRTGVRALWAAATESWFTPLAVLVGLFNVLMAAAVLFSLYGESKGPGRVIGPVILLVLATALFAGLCLRWRAGQPPTVVTPGRGPAPAPDTSRPTVRARIGLGFVALLAVVAVALGALASLILLVAGVLTLAGVVVVVRRGGAPAQPRAPKRSAGAEHVILADVLIILGTLPALGLWWMVFPTILALVVIGGVIGTGPNTRRRPAY